MKLKLLPKNVFIVDYDSFSDTDNLSIEMQRVLSYSSNNTNILGRIPANWAPYHGHSFRIAITLPRIYPFDPPTFKFIDIPLHPNIQHDGTLCIPLLNEYMKYSPTFLLADIIKVIVNLLQNPDLTSPIHVEVACLYVLDRAMFNQKALEVAKRFLS